MLVDGFNVARVDVCWGMERFRIPTSGTDLVPLTYRLTVIINRDSGLVEILGNPEKWHDLPKSKQIRKAKPARISMTIFGNDGEVGIQEADQGKNLAEGDRNVKSLDKEEQPSSSIMMPDVSMEDAQPKVETGEISGVPSKETVEPDVEMGIMGHHPESVPRHGPRFLELSKEDRDWIHQVHNRMGHPDPARLAQFLKSTHAAENMIAGSMDFQCDACLETQKVFSRHDRLPFIQIWVLMRLLVWMWSVGEMVVGWNSSLFIFWMRAHFSTRGCMLY